MTGLEIKAARERAGLTQAQLAARLGVAAVTVFRWESGRSRPQPGHMARLSREFKYAISKGI